MGLIFKPHTVTVSLPEEVVTDNVLTGHVADAQGTVRGQMTPTGSGAMFERFQVETSRPFLFLCDSGEGSKFATGGTVTWGARTFRVLSEARVHEGFGAADNCEVPLEEMD